MSPTCEVCGEAPASFKCRICGRLVCRKHFDMNHGICVVCRDLMCRVCGRRLSVDVCPLCGRLICRECSVELQPGIRVCRGCFANIDRVVKAYPRLSYLLRYLKQRNQRVLSFR